MGWVEGGSALLAPPLAYATALMRGGNELKVPAVGEHNLAMLATR